MSAGDSERIYGEHEVAEILARAIEHQEAGSDRQPQQGLTLSEIERVGAEVGISAEHVRRATAEVGMLGGTAESTLGTAASQVQAVRWIPGQLSEVEIENMYAEMKNYLGPTVSWWGRTDDDVKRLGRTYEWTHPDTAIRITVTDHGDGYSLRVFQSQLFSGTTAEAVGLTLMTGLAVGGLPAGLIGEAYGVLWALLILTITCTLSVAVIPRLVARARNRKAEKVELLADAAAQALLHANDFEPNRQGNEPLLRLPEEDEAASRDAIKDRSGTITG